MWFLASGILVLLLYVNPTVSKDTSCEGLMKDAILSLARVIRDNSQKVERYQTREHHSNENLNKAVNDLTKKVSMVDTFLIHFSKIEKQISNIEQLISQRDERERIQMQKTANSIENLETHLDVRLHEMENTISEVSRRMETTEPTTTTASVSALDIMSKLNDTEAHFLTKVAQIESNLNTMAIKNKEVAATQAERLNTAFTEINQRERNQVQKTESIIAMLDSGLKTQLDEIKDTINEVNQHVAPTQPTTTTKTITASDIIAKLNDTEAHFLLKIAGIESSLNTMAIKNKEETVTQAEKLKTAFTEGEKNQDQKYKHMITELDNHLKSQLNEIKDTINEVNQHVAPTQPTTTTKTITALDIISKLNHTEAYFLTKVAQIESNLNTMAIKNKEVAATQAERLNTAFTEINQRERNQVQKTESIIAMLDSGLKTQLDEIKDTINEVNQHVAPTQPTTTTKTITASDIIAKLNDTEVHFLLKIAGIESSLNTTSIKNEEETTMQAEKLQTIFTEVQNISGRLGEIESFLQKADEADKREEKKPIEPIIDIGVICDKQSRALGKVTELVQDTLNRIQDLPMTSEIQALRNETQEAIQEAKYSLQSAVSDKISGLIINASQNNEEIKHSIVDLRSDLANNAEYVNEKLYNIANGQKVMITTGDEVLDIKKRLDYGVKRIISEFNELLKSHGTVINDTLNEKIDGISHEIIDNHSKAFTNLTTKIDEEISQVWRQMNVISQEIKMNFEAIDKLNQQTKVYINNTTPIMDGMESKLDEINKHMSKVNQDLSYLLNQLSFVTQQFNQIKTSFGKVFQNIKASFKEVQEQANDLSRPGPHPIANDDIQTTLRAENRYGELKPN